MKSRAESFCWSFYMKQKEYAFKELDKKSLPLIFEAEFLNIFRKCELIILCKSAEGLDVFL